MAQTIADKTITTTWQSINTLSGIAVGDAMIIDNKSGSLILLAEGTEPAANNRDGVPLTTYKDTKSTKVMPALSLEIWGRVDADSGTAKVSIQEG
jgi:hypothetical protein